MKKILSLCLTIIMVFSMTLTVAANDNLVQSIDLTKLERMSTKDAKYYANQISDLTPDEYDEFISAIVSSSDDKIKLVKEIRKLGIELSDIKQVKVDKDGVETQASAYYAEISTYSSKRAGESYHTIHADFSLGSKEDSPATYDVIGIYYDSTKANYYSYGTSSYTSLKNMAWASSGLGVFNFYDDQLTTWTTFNTYYCTLRITPTVSGEWIDFGADFTHTYNINEYTTTGSASLSVNSVGLVTSSYGYSITQTIKETNWTIADTNAFYKQ